MLNIKREVDIYHNRSLDYKIASLSKNTEDFLKSIQKKYPQAKLCNQYVKYYTLYVNGIIKKLPADFWFKIDEESSSSGYRWSISTTIDIGISIGLCGFFLESIPNPYCKAVGRVLMLWGVENTASGIIQKIEEDKKMQKEEARRRRRDCSRCSKKCNDCEHCRKRHNLR